MHTLFEVLLNSLKEALFKPKDFFERAKRKAASLLLIPLISIATAETLGISILSAIQSLEVKTSSFFIKFMGTASDSFLTVAGAMVVSFGIYIGSNLYYAKLLRETSKETTELESQLQQAQAYQKLKGHCTKYLEAGDIDRALMMASLIGQNYRDEVRKDADFVQQLLDSADVLQLPEVRRLLLGPPSRS